LVKHEKKGCFLSPILFNIYIEEFFRSNRGSGEVVKVRERWIKAARFADDQKMMVRSQKNLQTMMDAPSTI